MEEDKKLEHPCQYHPNVEGTVLNTINGTLKGWICKSCYQNILDDIFGEMA